MRRGSAGAPTPNPPVDESRQRRPKGPHTTSAGSSTRAKRVGEPDLCIPGRRAWPGRCQAEGSSRGIRESALWGDARREGRLGCRCFERLSRFHVSRALDEEPSLTVLFVTCGHRRRPRTIRCCESLSVGGTVRSPLVACEGPWIAVAVGFPLMSRSSAPGWPVGSSSGCLRRCRAPVAVALTVIAVVHLAFGARGEGCHRGRRRPTTAVRWKGG